MMNVGLNCRGIDTYLAAGFDLCCPCVADDFPVNRLPGLFPQGLDVLLENRLTGVLSHLQKGEYAKGI